MREIKITLWNKSDVNLNLIFSSRGLKFFFVENTKRNKLDFKGVKSAYWNYYATIFCSS